MADVLVDSFEGAQTQNFSTGTNNGGRWLAQIFTASESYQITTVEVLIYRIGVPTAINISITPVVADGGLFSPDDIVSNLATGTIAGTDAGTDTGGTWVGITLGAGAALTSGVKYAITLSSTVAGDIRWIGQTNNGYAGGNYSRDLYGDEDWIAQDWDLTFKTYQSVTILGLAGTSVGASSVTGAIGANPVSVLGLVGTSSGTSSVTGAIAPVSLSILGLVGIANGVSSVSGAIGANPVSVLGLVGLSAGVSGVTGAIGANPVVVYGLVGVSVGISSVSGNITKRLSGVWQPPSITSYHSSVGYYRLLIVAGTWGTSPPNGVLDVDYELVASLLPNTLSTTKRLVACADSKIWVEDVV